MMKALTGIAVGFAVLVAASAYAGTTPVPPAPPKVTPVAPAPAAEGLFVVDGKDSAKLTITGEVRTRFEYQRNVQDFNGDSNDNLDFGDSRIRLGLDFKFSDGVRFFFQPQADYIWGGFNGYNQNGQLTDSNGDVSGAGSSERDSLDIYQAHVVWTNIVAGNVETKLTIGRQEITVGNEMVLGNNSRYNGLAHDAVMLSLKVGEVNFAAFGSKVVENDAGILNDAYGYRPTDFGDDKRADVQLFGLDANVTVQDVKIEGYLVLLDSEYRTNENGTQTSLYPYLFEGEVWTLGAMVKGDLMAMPDLQTAALDFSIEAATQMGRVGDGDAKDDVKDAYALEAEVGLTLNAAAQLKPRVALGLAWASGDDDAADDERNGFLPLATDTEQRLGDSDIIGLRNIRAEYIKLTCAPMADTLGTVNDKPKLELGAAYFRFDAMDKGDDGIGNTFASVSNDNDVGDELDLFVRYAFSKHTDVKVTYAGLDPADQIKEQAGAANSSAHRVFLELAVKW